MMAPYESLVGQRFGRLFAVAYVDTDAYGHAKFLCQCTCGVDRVVSAQSLKHSRSRSCGCLRRDSNRDRARRPTVPEHGLGKCELK
jgi:hypothetical protein